MIRPRARARSASTASSSRPATASTLASPPNREPSLQDGTQKPSKMLTIPACRTNPGVPGQVHANAIIGHLINDHQEARELQQPDEASLRFTTWQCSWLPH